MKRILSIIVSILMALSVNAQGKVINVYKTVSGKRSLVQSYVNNSSNTYRVDFAKLQLNISGTSTISGEGCTTTLKVSSISPTTNVSIPTVKWTSGNTSIATVDASTGVVSGHNDGTVTITATATDGSGATGTYNVTVTNLVNDNEYVQIGSYKWGIKNFGATSVSNGTSSYGTAYAYHAAVGDNGNTKPSYPSGWDVASIEHTKDLVTACTGSCSYSGSGNWYAPMANNATTYSGTITITTGGVYCIASGTTVDGITYSTKGILFVEKANTSHRLFLPAAGRSGSQTGDISGVWTSTYVSYSKGAYAFLHQCSYTTYYVNIYAGHSQGTGFTFPVRLVVQ